MPESEKTAAELFEIYADRDACLKQLALRMEAVKAARDEAAIALIGMVPYDGIAATSFGYAVYSLDPDYSDKGAMKYIPPKAQFKLTDLIDKTYGKPITEDDLSY